MPLLQNFLVLPGSVQAYEHCVTCEARSTGRLCDLPAPALRDFHQLKTRRKYAGGEVLFAEGEECTQIFILCRGSVKVSVAGGEEGVILRIAGPGAALGVISAISGNAHRVTATTLWPCELECIGREDFLHFLGQHSEAWMPVACLLSQYCDNACERIRSFGTARTATEKLAQLLLQWAKSDEGPGLREMSVAPVSRHEDIGRIIGASRETVTRLFGLLRKQRIAEMKGAVLRILDPESLRRAAGF